MSWVKDLFTRKKNPNKITRDSKIVIDLIEVIEAYPNKSEIGDIPELALYLARNCRVVVV